MVRESREKKEEENIIRAHCAFEFLPSIKKKIISSSNEYSFQNKVSFLDKGMGVAVTSVEV